MISTRLQTRLVPLWVILIVASGSLATRGQEARPNPNIEMQKQKMQVLDGLDGLWRGTMWTRTPEGARQELTRTERVGSMLDGSIKVVEGRGYNSQGQLVYNGFGVIAWDLRTGKYTLRWHARGRVQTHELELIEDGYRWSMPFGPGVLVHTTRVRDGKWQEVGERTPAGGDPVRFLEIDLERIADTHWPSADPVPPRDPRP